MSAVASERPHRGTKVEGRCTGDGALKIEVFDENLLARTGARVQLNEQQQRRVERKSRANAERR
jgi:hypothetical protein